MNLHQPPPPMTTISHQVTTLVVGISGATCSGKTSVVRNLTQKFEHTITIHQDDFYLEEKDIPKSPNGTPLFDVPESLDTKQLVARVRSTAECPYVQCDTCKQHEDRNAPHMVLVEGSMILSLSQLKPLLHFSFFITLDFDLCRWRRSLRTDYVFPDPPHYLEDYVWPAYEKQVEKLKLKNETSINFLDGSRSFEAILQEVVASVTPTGHAAARDHTLVSFSDHSWFGTDTCRNPAPDKHS